MSTYINCKEVRAIDGENIQNLFAGNIRRLLIEAKPDYNCLYEIRLRAGRPRENSSRMMVPASAPYFAPARAGEKEISR